MHKQTSLFLTGAAVLVVFFGTRSAMLALRPAPEVVETATPTNSAPADPVAPVAVDVEQEVKRYDSVEDYFRDAHPNGTATTHRLGLPPIKRDVSNGRKREILERYGSCVVCGSTHQLEVEHRRGLQNGGGNEDENLSVLCHECHVEKTAMDRSLRRQRNKQVKASRR